MKLATVLPVSPIEGRISNLPSLGLTDSVFDIISKTIIAVDTNTKKETPTANLVFWQILVLTALTVMGLWYCICYRPHTPGTSFSFIPRPPHRRAQ